MVLAQISFSVSPTSSKTSSDISDKQTMMTIGLHLRSVYFITSNL